MLVETSIEDRETALRTWISQKESVCPYAPGAAMYLHLPSDMASEEEWVAYYSASLKRFYGTRVEGKRIERLILIPSREWQSHDEGLAYATRAFWRLSAGYHMQTLNGRKHVSKALRGLIPEIDACERQGIRNPIVGRVSHDDKNVPHFKSMFLTAFSPVYRSKHFFRYAPASALVLVNAKALYEKRLKHARVMKSIDEAMLFGNVVEAMGGGLDICKTALADEAKHWETLLFSQYRLETPNWMRLPEPQITKTLESIDIVGVNELFSKSTLRFPLMSQICREFSASPVSVLKSAYLFAGLYVKPAYLK